QGDTEQIAPAPGEVVAVAARAELRGVGQRIDRVALARVDRELAQLRRMAARLALPVADDLVERARAVQRREGAAHLAMGGGGELLRRKGPVEAAPVQVEGVAEADREVGALGVDRAQRPFALEGDLLARRPVPEDRVEGVVQDPLVLDDLARELWL